MSDLVVRIKNGIGGTCPFRRPFLVIICLVLICACLSRQTDADEKPNIIVIVADDLGYGELGCQGNDQIPTPNINSIASSGVRFTQGYVTAAFCSASRAGILTGRYQTRFGYEFNPIGAKNEDPNAGLPVSEKTIADELRQAGYVSGLIGKWHLGGTAKYHPIRRGFDEFFGFMHEGHFFVPPPYPGATTWLRRKVLPGGGEGRWNSADKRAFYSTHLNSNEPAYDADNPIYRGGQPVVEREYLTDAFSREAVDFVKRNHDRPFFLLLSYNAVHSPLQAMDADLKEFAHIKDIQRRIFAAMLSSMDRGIGKVLKTVRDQKLEDNTLIFFLSDNGGPTKELTSSNGVLRDGKGSVYEGGLRVPFMMQWKDKLPAGKVFEAPVSSLDIFATATSVAGRKLGSKKIYDGVNLIPFVNGENKSLPHDSFFWRIGNRKAIRVGNWKLLKNPKRSQQTDWELYNLADDISESHDLADKIPEKRSELLERFESLNREMMDPLWKP